MAKFFLSMLMFVAAFTCCRAAANINEEFAKLGKIGNKALLDKGYQYIEQGKYDSAMIYYSVVANHYYDSGMKKKDIPSIVKALQNMGIIYMTCDYDYRKSYDYLLRAKELAEDNNCYEKLPNIYNCIANILQLSGQGGESSGKNDVVAMLRKSFALAKKQNDMATMSITIENLIQLSFEKKRYNCDISNEVKEFLRISNTSRDSSAEQARLMCLSYLCNKRGEWQKAVRLLERSISKSDKKPLSYRAVLTCRGFMTKILMRNKRYSDAISSIEKSLAIACQNKSLDYESALYGDLSQVYSDMGDSLKADKYELLYLRSNKKLLSEANLSNVRNVKFIRELDKANEQVRVLSEKRRMQNILLVCAVAVLCIIITLLYRIFKANRKILQNYRYLYNKNVELLAKDAEARRNRNAKQEEQHSKYKGSKLTDDDTRELFSSILQVMENSNEIYSLGFTVDRLSDIVHSRPRYVSQAINKEYGSNFNTLLNEYRIKEACRRLSGNPDYVNMTIEGIAESVGFKSRTSFGALFKTATGLSPSAYQRMAKEKQV